MNVLPLPGKGPEDVLCTPDGDVLTGLADGRLLSVTPSGTVRELAQTGGRPLGLEWLPDGRVLVCDGARGLLALEIATGRLEVLADSLDGERFAFCNNAAVAADGTIYFTDSSRRFGIATWRGAILEHAGDGRLLRRSPDGSLDVLCDGLEFANGVALSADESWVAVAQTGGYTLERVDVSGTRGRERFVDLPGFPDNISTGSDGLVWVAMAGSRNPLLDRLHSGNPRVRHAVWSVPQRLQPAPPRMAWVMAFDESCTLVHDFQGSVPGFSMCTGVREQSGRVWMGGLEAMSVAWFEVEQ
ncbi:SMP-30/gluconolactonase/LRE family protein [Angustibacter sp. McL0619]|uniref:SMP-30/gluconolactonase/LRE family protein n=1 Tax=Angustibacter sp. McL0619 TaxID=3415676 RepID=UPI003CF28DDF